MIAMRFAPSWIHSDGKNFVLAISSAPPTQKKKIKRSRLFKLSRVKKPIATQHRHTVCPMYFKHLELGNGFNSCAQQNNVTYTVEKV